MGELRQTGRGKKVTAESVNTMEMTPEPFFVRNEVPLKNPFCPHYGKCLNLAAKAGWVQFTCCRCGFRSVHISIHPDYHETEACYRLLTRIFSAER